MLRLKSELDRETVPSFVVKVTAVDGGAPSLTSTATVTVTVQDINDNSPVFAPYDTVYEISEAAEIGKTIATISATDADLEEFGLVVYTFDVNNDDTKLGINGTTVKIFQVF